MEQREAVQVVLPVFISKPFLQTLHVAGGSQAAQLGSVQAITQVVPKELTMYPVLQVLQVVAESQVAQLVSWQFKRQDPTEDE